MKKTRIFKKSTVLFPKSEKKLIKKFRQFRKVGVPVSGPYLQAKMLQYVAKEKDADPKKVKAFKASAMWLQGFMQRKGISVRTRTNKKSRSAIKRSRLMRNWHWNIMYNLPYQFSKRKSFWNSCISKFKVTSSLTFAEKPLIGPPIYRSLLR